MATYKNGSGAEKDNLHTKHVELSTDAQLAQVANVEDHELGIWKSLVRYPWASAWCVYACWTIILIGFYVQAAGAVVGIPSFRKDFGYKFEGDYVLPAVWQSSFSGAPVATAVISSIASAELADFIGRKKVLAIALLISFVAVAIEFIATTNAVFFAGKLLNGFMVGAVGTIMVSYIGETTPLALRGIITCGVGVGYGIGPLVAFIVVDYTGTADSRWAYRTVSPWWLISKGKKEETLKTLGRLGHTGTDGRAKLALIERRLEEVRQETEGVTYLECFKKSNLRRTVISIMPLMIQAFSGISWVAGYFTYYLQLARYSTSMCYKLQIAQQVLSIVSNLVAAAVIDRIGRRNLTFYGLGILTAFLLITGGLGTGTTQPMIKGTSAFSVLAETSTSRLRAKTVAIGYASQNGISVMWQFVIPYMLNPDKANLGAKLAFVFGGLCFFSLLYLWYFQPETSGRSYEELDEMFTKGVPARKSKKYKTTVQMRIETCS
ncbi:alpha glucoside transporter [Colletotrichum caudatum]|nr:alpha glucoside transporter [Colletotrichum caudatum]